MHRILQKEDLYWRSKKAICLVYIFSYLIQLKKMHICIWFVKQIQHFFKKKIIKNNLASKSCYSSPFCHLIYIFEIWIYKTENKSQFWKIRITVTLFLKPTPFSPYECININWNLQNNMQRKIINHDRGICIIL